MQDYIAANRLAYDATAQEFQDKVALRQSGTEQLVTAFLHELVTYNGQTGPQTILELGPGSGYASQLMSQAGHHVTAIEFSEPMAKAAQQTAPWAHVVHAEFLSHDFGSRQFDAVVAIAFIHLFTAKDAALVMQKIASLLKPTNGLALISTTKHNELHEGYETKTNFKSQQQRFRRRYTPEALDSLLSEAGLTIMYRSENDDAEVANKVWMQRFVTSGTVGRT